MNRVSIGLSHTVSERTGDWKNAPYRHLYLTPPLPVEGVNVEIL